MVCFSSFLLPAIPEKALRSRWGLDWDIRRGYQARATVRASCQGTAHSQTSKRRHDRMPTHGAAQPMPALTHHRRVAAKRLPDLGGGTAPENRLAVAWLRRWLVMCLDSASCRLSLTLGTT